MRIGFTLPQFGEAAHHPDELMRFAREAERLGAASFWVHDRLLAAIDPAVGYFGAEGDFPEVFRSMLDPFATLAVVATVTDTARIGTNVLNTPWYTPALLARMLTSLDVISNGRLNVGLGAGWSPEEFSAAGVPLDERGVRMEETLDVLDLMWTANPVEYHGSRLTVPATYVDLKPVQTPRPPVYLATFAPASMRRAARRADGFLPVVVPGGPGSPRFDPTVITEPHARMREMAEKEGRDPASFGAILQIYPTADAGVEEVVEYIVRAGQEAAVDHVIVDFMYHFKNTDQGLELVGRVLELAKKG